MTDRCPPEQTTPASKRRASTWRRRSVGPYSRSGALSMMDGRTREARFLARTRDELTAHLGGKPSAKQAVLIERAAMLRLHLAQLDEKALRGGSLTDHDQRQYLAWSNSLDRALRHLGMKGAEAKPITLADILANPPGDAA